MKIKNIITILLVAFLLASCLPAAKVVPTKIATPTSTIAPIQPTSTITASPTDQSLKCDPNQESTSATTSNTDIFTANEKLNHTVSLGEALEFPDKGHWLWITKEETFYMVKAAGFSAVRIAIDFAHHADSASPYTIQQSFWEDVDSVVEKAIACRLVVIVNMHNFDAEAQIPYTDEKRFISLWNEIAEHYKNYPDNTLYFEPYNEPGDPEYWNNLLAKGISSIRKSNPTRPIIIDVGDWAQISGFSTLRLPSDPNLIVSFHYYTPSEFTHQCVNFIEGAKAWCGTTWENTPDQIAKINQDFDKVAEWGKKQWQPIFLGEFGSISIADSESRIRWTIAVREAAIAHGFSWGYWDLCDTSGYDGSSTFGIFDCYKQPLSTSDWRQEMLQALIPEP
jgi:endoglucanase